MPVRYVTEADWDAINGAALRESLFVGTGDAYDVDEFNRAAEFASKHAQSVAKKAGYTIPEDTDGTVVDDFIKLVTLGTLTRLGYARRQQEVPADVKELFVDLIEGARTGVAPDPDLTPNTLEGIGGSSFASPSSRVSTATSVFGTLKHSY